MGFRTAPNSPIQSGDLLGALGGSSSFGYGINQSGQAVGAAFVVGDRSHHAFRTALNAPVNPATDDLGVLLPSHAASLAINNTGQVIGWSAGPGNGRAFRSTPDGQPVVLTNLGTLGHCHYPS